MVEANVLSTLKRSKAFLLGFHFFVLIALPHPMSALKDSVCGSSECITKANIFNYNMDKKVNPCENFYQFACGGFLKKIKIPADKPYWNVVAEVNNVILNEVTQEINNLKNNKKISSSFKKSVDFQSSCMNEDLINKKGVKVLLPQLAQLGGWPMADAGWKESNFDLVDAKIKLFRSGLPTDMLFEFSPVIDWKNPNRQFIQLRPGSVGLTTYDLYKGLSDPAVDAYYSQMMDSAFKLGATSKNDTDNDILDILALEYDIASNSFDNSSTGTYESRYHLVTVRDLEVSYPYIPWLRLFTESLKGFVQVSHDQPVQLLVPEFFSSLGDLLKETPKRILANYVVWRVVQGQGPYLSKEWQKIFQRVNNVQTGTTKLPPRSEVCFTELQNRLGPIASSIYVRKFFNDKTQKKNVADLAASLQQQFLDILQSDTWIGSQTLAVARDKIKKLAYFIGAPEELYGDQVLDSYYKMVQINPSDFYGNIINLQIFQRFQDWSILYQPVILSKWVYHTSSTTVDVTYGPQSNSIEIPPAILNPILYSSTKPDYLILSVLGYLIAYSQAFALNDQGWQFDAQGKLKDCCDAATNNKFQNKYQMISDQYSTFFVKEANMTLYGGNVYSSASSDLAAFKISYMTFRRLEALRNQPLLPSFEHLSPRQLFWLSAANFYCTKERKASLIQDVLLDNLAPQEFRINGPFRNSPDFAADWNCPSGSFMNPKEKVGFF